MVTARINLKGTINDEVLFTALIEKAESYVITVNNTSKEANVRTKANRKVEFDIDTSREGNVFSLNISPEMPITQKANLKVIAYRKIEGNSTKIVVTIDIPYVTETDAENRYIIVHPPHK